MIGMKIMTLMALLTVMNSVKSASLKERLGFGSKKSVDDDSRLTSQGPLRDGAQKQIREEVSTHARQRDDKSPSSRDTRKPELLSEEMTAKRSNKLMMQKESEEKAKISNKLMMQEEEVAKNKSVIQEEKVRLDNLKALHKAKVDEIDVYKKRLSDIDEQGTDIKKNKNYSEKDQQKFLLEIEKQKNKLEATIRGVQGDVDISKQSMNKLELQIAEKELQNIKNKKSNAELEKSLNTSEVSVADTATAKLKKLSDKEAEKEAQIAQKKEVILEAEKPSASKIAGASNSSAGKTEEEIQREENRRRRMAILNAPIEKKSEGGYFD